MPVSAAPASTLGVLLIEDDDDDALIVEDLLTESPAEVVLRRGRTLREGLALLRGEIDCVLLDLRLPDVVGMEAVTQLREAAPWIAVVVLTGLDDERAGQAAVDVGAQDYLVKGKVDGELLARAIHYAVARRHAEDVQQQLRVAEVRADETARLERGLVPRPILHDPSLWIASTYLPGRQRALLGGDFYDAVHSDDRLQVIIGDVSGRGPDEAALGAGLRIAWRALTLAGAPAGGVIDTLQLMIENERQDPRTFATLCTLEIEVQAGRLSLRRAGHLTPMLISDSGAVTILPLDGGGPPIGMFAGVQWPESAFELSEPWTLLLYTDGLIEFHDGDSDPLGEEGLRTLLSDQLARRADWRTDPRRLLDELIARVKTLNGREFDDDVAVLLLGSRDTGPAD